MNNEEPSTDYGLSSEIDIIFSEMKENKKLKNTGEPSQATSLQFVSQTNDKTNAKDVYKEDKHTSSHVENADDKLITWAARLELESISLKEIVTGNLGHIFKQNYDFLKVACEEMTTKLSQMTCQIEEVKKTSSGYDTNEKLLETVNILSEKVTTIEKMFKPCSSRDTRNSVGSIETFIGEQVDYTLSNNKLLKEMIKNTDKTFHRLEKLERLLQETICESSKANSKEHSKICNILESHDKATFDKLLSLQRFISDNDLGSNQSLSQEIVSIKQYLKLLLPRIIGLETNSKKLFNDYHELQEILNTKIHLNPTKFDNINLSENPLVDSTVCSTSKRILDEASVPGSTNMNQKKRKII